MLIKLQSREKATASMYSWGFKKSLVEVSCWDMLVIDECQELANSWHAKISQVLGTRRWREVRLGLGATPLPWPRSVELMAPTSRTRILGQEFHLKTCFSNYRLAALKFFNSYS